jgi:ABC-type transport system involved in multi-copper enzyme maturation permease subunit
MQRKTIDQILAVVRLELKRHVLARRWLGIYFLALAPVLLALVASVARRNDNSLAEIGSGYAAAYQLFILRFAIFLSCALVFSQLFRGEVLEKTLHFYLLVPVRRWIIALGKYVGGAVVVSILFGVSTAASFLLAFYRSPGFRSFLLEGPGLAHLASYLVVTVLASLAYGAIFLVVGLLFRNPAPSLAILLAWESFSFFLTAFFQKLSVAYSLQSLLPVRVDIGPFAVIVEPISPMTGILGLLLISAAMLAVAGWLFGRAQVTYSTD